MSIQTKLNIGLFGFGVVGESLWQVLNKTTSLQAQVTKVCIRHPEKLRSAPQELFTTDAEDLLGDASINTIVELIDDADAAFEIVKRALTGGKAVVSANKKMIAEHLQELLDMQRAHGVPFLYEAACCASIPIIRNLEEYYDNDLLRGLNGIVNGSTNYILSKMAADQLSFGEALAQAQAFGFAERNPALDVEGVDAVNKLSILLLHAYGAVTDPREIVHSGITSLHELDARYAREKGQAIKLVAHARKLANEGIAAFVLPQLVDCESPLFNVNNEYNGVVIESGLADRQFFTGKGAGGFPTASAVTSDLSALRYNYRYEYKKRYNQVPSGLTDNFYINAYISFPAGEQGPGAYFEHIDEWAGNNLRSYIVGTIHFTQLLASGWWKRPGVSLILLQDAFALGESGVATQSLLAVEEHEIHA